MADSKISELTAATSIGSSDLLYLVQSNTSKKVTVATLLSNLSNATLYGNITIGGTVQTLATPGSINLTTPITHLAADASGGVLTMSRGSAGQLKYITLQSTAGGSFTLSGNVAGGSTVHFDRVGDAVQLLYTGTQWYVVGGTANVTY